MFNLSTFSELIFIKFENSGELSSDIITFFSTESANKGTLEYVLQVLHVLCNYGHNKTKDKPRIFTAECFGIKGK